MKRSLTWWLKHGRARTQQQEHEARPQAIRVGPGWDVIPKVNPRPLRMSNVIPFPLSKPEYVPPATDKRWDDETAKLLMQWAKEDAGSQSDSGDVDPSQR